MINPAVLNIGGNRVSFQDENDRLSAIPGSLNATGEHSMFGLKSGNPQNAEGRYPAQTFIDKDIPGEQYKILQKI